MSRFFFLLREALVNLKRNFLVVDGAILAVFISLSLAFGALVVNEILRLNTLAWQEGVHVIAFLKDEGTSGVPAGAHQALLQEVLTWEEVKPPDTGGYDCYRRLRAACPGATVALTTGFGYDVAHSIVKARADGMRHVLFKPFRQDQVVRAVLDGDSPSGTHTPV